MQQFFETRTTSLILAVLASAILGTSRPASAQDFEFDGTLDNCGGLCLALGSLFGITTGSPIEAFFESDTGRFCGQVGTGGGSGKLNWDTSLTTGAVSTCAAVSFDPLAVIDFGWLENPASPGLTNDPASITGGFLVIDNFADLQALADILVYMSGSGPQDFGIPGGVVATWVAYLTLPGGGPDPQSVVGSGSGAWHLSSAAPPDIDVNPITLDFGDVIFGSIARGIVTVTNTGAGVLTLQSLSLSGTNLDFSISPAVTGACTTGALQPATSCMIHLDFAPSTTGPANESLTITSDDPDEPEVTIPIGGNGVSAMIFVTPTMFDFGEVLVNTTASLVLGVVNTGNGPLIVPGIDPGNTLSGTAFSIVGEDCTSISPLPPLGTCMVTVRYAPTQAGVDAATFSIVSNDPNMPSTSISLFGEGVPVPDTDGDSITDDLDNCTLIANAPQTDTDGDGYGNRCDADYNNDCSVDFLDLGTLKSAFFTQNSAIDTSGDGFIDFLDLGYLKSVFFGAPGPGLGVCRSAGSSV